MFKDFWEKKKHVIEMSSILTAIGALFLNINLPADESAKNALLNIQMVWLLIISIMGIILFFTFWSFAAQIDNKIEKKISHELYYSIFGFIIVVVGGYFLINLWKYFIALYKKEFLNFLPMLYLIPASAGSLVVILLKNKYTKYYLAGKKIKYYFGILGTSFLAGLVYSFLAEIITELNLNLLTFLSRLFIGIGMAFLLCLSITKATIKESVIN